MRWGPWEDRRGEKDGLLSDIRDDHCEVDVPLCGDQAKTRKNQKRDKQPLWDHSPLASTMQREDRRRKSKGDGAARSNL